MAEEDDLVEGNEDEENGEKKPSFFKKNKKLILVVALGLALVCVSVGGTLLAINLLTDKPEKEEVVAEEEARPPPLPQAIYYPLKPPIMVSFDAKGRQRLVQVEITLMSRQTDAIAAVEMHMPRIRNALVLLISGRTYDEVQTAEGKELLRIACLQELQQIMQDEIGKPGIEQVLFTGFIVQ